MPCAHPIRGYRGRGGKVTFSPAGALSLKMVKVGCGRCLYCRREHARNWAVRCMCEASLHSLNCFATLTYKPDDPEYDGTLHVEHLQLLFKKMRKRGLKFRYLACGEYGEKNDRPHYHVLFFGISISFPELEEIWKHGLCHVGNLTTASASYVAQYSLKKITGKWEQYYLDPETGEYVTPPYLVCSRRPGIGRPWLDRYMADIFPSDSVAFDGRLVRPPDYYVEVLKKVNPLLAEQVLAERVDNSISDEERCRREDLSEELLAARYNALKSRHRRV